MLDKPLVINDRSKVEETYSTTIKYLEQHSDLHSSLANAMWAYYEIGDLIPQTLDNIMSGHYFPYSESYYELENSYQLSLEGFYTYAFVALRSVLELGILGVYFAIEDKEYEKVKPWLKSQQATPSFREMLAKLSRLNYYKQFDQKFNLIARVSLTYSHLSDFVHTRGYRYSSRGQTLSNFNRFSEKAFKEYSKLLKDVVSNIIVIMLLKYPIGMQSLPLYKKFGLNAPVGGFLEGDQVSLISSMIHQDERDFLKELSDSDPAVQDIVKYFESLPDLPDEEWKKQSEDFDKRFPHSKNNMGQNGV